MNSFMAPSRGSSFEGRMFFVYDREAVKKEADPPEDAILFFYPHGASIDDQVSICGQIVGMTNFLSSLLGASPVLLKLETEKVAIYQTGQYTLALGGTLTEPDSLLIRQQKTLYNLFAFYHGCIDSVRKMCRNHTSFLTRLNTIWECYLPFVRHYGDSLPAVFDPLPFLETPKNSSAGFLKASHILQAFQRRHHILGGCILYSNSVLCTQLDPAITKRLLLLKPNQSHHPAKPVKTDINLPFGVRILNSYVTLYEYQGLFEALSQSPYRQYTAQEAQESSGVTTCLRSDSTSTEEQAEARPGSATVWLLPDDQVNGDIQRSHSSTVEYGNMADKGKHRGKDGSKESLLRRAQSLPTELISQYANSSDSRQAKASGSGEMSPKGSSSCPAPMAKEKEMLEETIVDAREDANAENFIPEGSYLDVEEDVEDEVHLNSREEVTEVKLRSSTSSLTIGAVAPIETTPADSCDVMKLEQSQRSEIESPVKNDKVVESSPDDQLSVNLSSVTGPATDLKDRTTEKEYSLSTNEEEVNKDVQLNTSDNFNDTGAFNLECGETPNHEIVIDCGLAAQEDVNKGTYAKGDMNVLLLNDNTSNQEVRTSDDEIDSVASCDHNTDLAAPEKFRGGTNVDLLDDNLRSSDDEIDSDVACNTVEYSNSFTEDHSQYDGMLIMEGIDVNGLKVTRYEKDSDGESGRNPIEVKLASIEANDESTTRLDTSNASRNGDSIENVSNDDSALCENISSEKVKDQLNLAHYNHVIKGVAVIKGAAANDLCGSQVNFESVKGESQMRRNSAADTEMSGDSSKLMDESEAEKGIESHVGFLSKQAKDERQVLDSKSVVDPLKGNIECESPSFTDDQSETNSTLSDQNCSANDFRIAQNKCTTYEIRTPGSVITNPRHSRTYLVDCGEDKDDSAAGETLNKQDSDSCDVEKRISVYEDCREVLESPRSSVIGRILHDQDNPSSGLIPARKSLIRSSSTSDDNIERTIEWTSDERESPSKYHDTVEDVVTDAPKSYVGYIAQMTNEIYKDYSNFDEKENLQYASKYSPRNLNVAAQKSIEKCLFKDATVKNGNLNRLGNTLGTSSSSQAEQTRLSSTSANSENSRSSSYNAGGPNNDCDASVAISCKGNTICEITECDITDAGHDFQAPPEDCLQRREYLGENGSPVFQGESSTGVEEGTNENPPEDVTDSGVGAGGESGRVNSLSRDGPSYSDEGDGIDEDRDDHDNDDKTSAHRVDGMVHINLYVQAHSDIVLILLAEPTLHTDSDTIKALWRTTVNELGELEFRIQQALGKSPSRASREEYSFLVYDAFDATMKGNQREPISSVDHVFCDTAKTVHEHFNNSESLRSITLRGQTSAVYGQRSLDQEVYYQRKGSFRAAHGVPSPRDPVFNLERRTGKVLHKEHGVNVF